MAIKKIAVGLSKTVVAQPNPQNMPNLAVKSNRYNEQ
jgi:hypothetical protein